MLTSGIGSKIEMETSLESHSGGIGVLAVHDEGSAIASSDPSFVRSMSLSLSTVYSYLILYSILTIGYAFFVFLYRRWVRARFIRKLVTKIQDWRQKLENNPYICEKFTYTNYPTMKIPRADIPERRGRRDNQDYEPE